MRRPGVEPGSTAWKATMLTVTPPTPDEMVRAIPDINTIDNCFSVLKKYINVLVVIINIHFN